MNNEITPEQAERARRVLTDLLDGRICPQCHEPLTSREQVGRSVYARPCGCRLYQGTLPKSERTPS